MEAVKVMSSGLVPISSVRCVMCGRTAGHLVYGMFVRDGHTRSPTVDPRGVRCGECGGNLLVEPEEPVTPAMAADVIARRPRLASGADSSDRDSQAGTATRRQPARESRSISTRPPT
jgi:hypothetical protein